MNTRQLGLLFICNFVPFMIGQSMYSLLPVYATRLGASSAESGILLAAGSAALMVGTFAAGWLFNRIRRPRAMIIVTGLLAVPVTFLMGQVPQVWELLVLLVLLWVLSGIAIATVAIIAGMDANESERGKIFGIIATGVGIGGMIGGGVSGPIVDRWGYSALFSLLAPWYLLQSLAAAFLIIRAPAVDSTGNASNVDRQPLGTPFYLLFFAAIAASIPEFISGLARPLQMDQLKFDAAAISSIFSLTAAASIPVPLLLGWLSDRLGRYPMLALCMFAALIGMVVLSGSSVLWQFALSGTLLSIANSVGSIGQALVADIVPSNSLGAALARFGATGWIGGVIGLLGAGYMIQGLGFVGACIVGVLLAVLSIVLLVGVYRTGTQQVAIQAA